MNSSSAELEVLQSLRSNEASKNMPWFLCAKAPHLPVVQRWKLLQLKQKWISLDLQIKLAANLAWVCDANGIIEQFKVQQEIEELLNSRPQWAQ